MNTCPTITSRRFTAVLSAGLSAGLCAATAVAGDLPIQIEPLLIETEIGPARGWAATIDLTSPEVDIVVTAPRDDATRWDATLTPTDVWAADAGVALAINANFFAQSNDRDADLIGLSASAGVIASPARSHNGVGDPALIFGEDGAARVLRCDPCEGVYDAVAGVGGSSNAETPGALLLENGVIHADRARVQPMVRHPRTGAGVSADGETLYLVVIDGRQPGWSVGVTLVELAETLRDLGADDALNLDGGGSSSFVSYVSETGDVSPSPAITNRPSDGRFRPVANHLGVRLVSHEPAGGLETPAAASPTDVDRIGGG